MCPTLVFILSKIIYFCLFVLKSYLTIFAFPKIFFVIFKDVKSYSRFERRPPIENVNNLGPRAKCVVVLCNSSHRQHLHVWFDGAIIARIHFPRGNDSEIWWYCQYQFLKVVNRGVRRKEKKEKGKKTGQCSWQCTSEVNVCAAAFNTNYSIHVFADRQRRISYSCLAHHTFIIFK